MRQQLERLEQLPPRERVVLCMLHLDGLRQIEIAEVLGLSKGQVSKLVAQPPRTLGRGLGLAHDEEDPADLAKDRDRVRHHRDRRAVDVWPATLVEVRGGVPRVKTWPVGQLTAGKRVEKVLL